MKERDRKEERKKEIEVSIREVKQGGKRKGEEKRGCWGKHM